MKKLIIICSILMMGIVAKSQNTNVSVASCSPVPHVMEVGDVGIIEIVISNVGQDIPAGCLEINLSVSNYLDFGTTPTLVDGFGMWELYYSETDNNSTVMYIQNTLAIMPHFSTSILEVPFVAANVCGVDEGVANANADWSVNDGCLISEIEPADNAAWGYFTVNEPLPITLAKFDATNQDCKNIQLSWTSLNETNFKGYEIEKSLDGKVYKSIGQIAGKRNTNIKSDYVFNDTQFGNESKAYYRLKCVDLDGSISYSSIRSVDLGCAGNVDFEVFPNPASNYLKVEMKGFGKGLTKKAEILNSKGQVVQTVVVGTGMVNNINIESLISGMYVLRLIDTDGVSEKKFVKIN